MSNVRERDPQMRRPRPPHLRVATFNIRTGLGWDGRHCGRSAPGRARRRSPASRPTSSVSRRSTPFRSAAGAPAARVRGRRRRAHNGRDRGERCTVAFLASRVRLEAWTVRWFSDTPCAPGSRSWGNPIARIVTLCRFTDLRTGDRFGVANAHWDGASAASRVRSAAALLTWLDPELPWIVLGDLNATAGDPAVARLLAGGLRDTLAQLGERGPEAATHHQGDGSTDGTRFDYVLVDDHWDVRGARIDHARPGGRLPSDHWPVVAEVTLRPAAS